MDLDAVTTLKRLDRTSRSQHHKWPCYSRHWLRMTIAVERPLVQAVAPDKVPVSGTCLLDNNAVWQSLDRRRFNASPEGAIQFHLLINIAGQHLFAVSIAGAPRGKKCIVSVASASGAGPMTGGKMIAGTGSKNRLGARITMPWMRAAARPSCFHA